MTYPRLTPSEDRVLRLKAKGLTNYAVAYELGVSEQTIKNEVSTLYARLGVESLVGAIRVMGWMHVPDEPRPLCDAVGKCSRTAGHTGHHGGFRV